MENSLRKSLKLDQSVSSEIQKKRRMIQINSINQSNGDISSTERGMIQNILDEESKRITSIDIN